MFPRSQLASKLSNALASEHSCHQSTFDTQRTITKTTQTQNQTTSKSTPPTHELESQSNTTKASLAKIKQTWTPTSQN